MDETEEEIANQLQELQTLMATLDISEKNKNIENPEDGYRDEDKNENKNKNIIFSKKTKTYQSRFFT